MKLRFLIVDGESHLLAMCLEKDFCVQGKRIEENDFEYLRFCIKEVIAAHKEFNAEEGGSGLSHLDKIPDEVKVQVNKIIDVWEMECDELVIMT